MALPAPAVLAASFSCPLTVRPALPTSFVEKMKVKDASIKLQATNLFLIYADKKLNGQDPEFFNTGGVAVPVPKQFTLTLKLGL